MLYKSRAISLHTIRFGDTSLIVHLYTEKYGRQAFILKGIKSKKSSLRTNLFFPLNILNIEAYYRPNQKLQRMKEVVNQPVYNSLHFHPVKSAISFFLAEILYKILQAEQSNTPLFEFLYQSFLFFDCQENEFSNFHLIFLIQLLKYEGFFPEDNYSVVNNSFNIYSGNFHPYSHSNDRDMNEINSRKFMELLHCDYLNMSSLALSSEDRMYFLTKIVEYYQIHFHGLGQIKSLPVLHELFHS
jgi:DNA repair protein RecO (recombination protein O)